MDDLTKLVWNAILANEITTHILRVRLYTRDATPKQVFFDSFDVEKVGEKSSDWAGTWVKYYWKSIVAPRFRVGKTNEREAVGTLFNIKVINKSKISLDARFSDPLFHVYLFQKKLSYREVIDDRFYTKLRSQKWMKRASKIGTLSGNYPIVKITSHENLAKGNLVLGGGKVSFIANGATYKVVPQIYLPTLLMELEQNPILVDALYGGNKLEPPTNLELACVFRMYINTLNSTISNLPKFKKQNFEQLCKFGRSGFVSTPSDHVTNKSDKIIRNFCGPNGFDIADFAGGKKYSLLRDKTQEDLDKFCACTRDPCDFKKLNEDYRIACEVEKLIYNKHQSRLGNPNSTRKCYSGICNSVYAYQTKKDDAVKCIPYCMNINIQRNSAFSFAEANKVLQYCGSDPDSNVDKIRERLKQRDALKACVVTPKQWGKCEYNFNLQKNVQYMELTTNGAQKCNQKLLDEYGRSNIVKINGVNKYRATRDCTPASKPVVDPPTKREVPSTPEPEATEPKVEVVPPAKSEAKDGSNKILYLLIILGVFVALLTAYLAAAYFLGFFPFG